MKKGLSKIVLESYNVPDNVWEL